MSEKINKAKEDAPNYRESDLEDKFCDNCKFNQEGFCTLFEFDFDEGFICDAWEPEEKAAEGKALELEKPHGFLMWRGKQTAIANDEPLPVGKPLTIVSGGEAYGVVTLTEPALMTVKRFDDQEQQEEHCVRSNERRLWWPNVDALYVHRFEEWQPLEKSTLAEVKDGSVVFRQPDRLSQEEKELVGISKTLPKQISLDQLVVAINTKNPAQISAPANMPVELKTALSRVLRSTFQQEAEFVDKARFDHIPLYELALIRSPRLEVKRVGEIIVEALTTEEDDVDNAGKPHRADDEDDDEKIYDADEMFLEDEKRRWTRKFINDLPDSHFLYVESGGDLDSERKTTPRRLRHFPYKNSSGDVDLPHLRNGIARASQAKDKDGKRLSDTLVSRIQKEAREILERENAKRGKSKGVEADEAETEEKAGRRLRKSWIDKLKDFGDVLKELLHWAQYQDVDMTKEFGAPSGFSIKEVDGHRWYFSWSTNAFEDRQEETFSTKCLEQYVKEASEKQDRGFFNFWHIEGTDFALKEWQAVVGRFLVEAGPFLDNEAGKRAKEFFTKYSDGHPDFAPEGWGSSPEFRYLPEERERKVYDWIWITRTSTLPRAAAANVWTKAGQEVIMALEGQQKEAAIALFGESFVEKLINEGEKKTDDLESSGVAHKQAPDETTKQADVFAEALQKLAEGLEAGAIKEQLMEMAQGLTDDNLADQGGDLQTFSEQMEDEELRSQLSDIAEQMIAHEEEEEGSESEAEQAPETDEGKEQPAFTIDQIVEALSSKMEADFVPFAEALASIAVDVKGLSTRLDKVEKAEAFKQKTDIPRFMFNLQRASEAEETKTEKSDPLFNQKPQEELADGSMASRYFTDK